MNRFPTLHIPRLAALWRRPTVRWATFTMALAAGLRVAAQPAGPPGSPEDNLPPEALSRLNNMEMAADSGQLEEMPGPDEGTATNSPSMINGPAGGTNRFNATGAQGTIRFSGSNGSSSDDRRARGRRSFRSRSARDSGSSSGYSAGGDSAQPTAPAGTNNAVSSLDYAAFRIIVDRNIFDPNRFARGPGRVRSRPRSVDWLKLTGTMSYTKGTFAVFDSNSSDYRQVLKPADSIAGFKLTNIADNGVKLVSGTNVLDLAVGQQLRREEDGPWLLSDSPGSYSETPASTSASSSSTPASAAADAAASGPDSDILKRMMERRAKQ